MASCREGMGQEQDVGWQCCTYNPEAESEQEVESSYAVSRSSLSDPRLTAGVPTLQCSKAMPQAGDQVLSRGGCGAQNTFKP